MLLEYWEIVAFKQIPEKAYDTERSFTYITDFIQTRSKKENIVSLYLEIIDNKLRNNH